jgi:hypothetical protein
MENQEASNEESDFRTKIGIEPKELLKAPLKPPDFSDNRKPTDRQKWRFLIGLIVLLIGVILYPLSIYLTVVVALLGLGVTVYGVLVRE